MYLRMRTLAGALVVICGVLQVIAPWLLPVSPLLLLTALLGSVYFLLALGLFGVGRLSLLLAVLIPGLRAWFGVWPLPLRSLEVARVILDIAVPLLSAPVLWHTLHPDYRPHLPGLHGKGADRSHA